MTYDLLITTLVGAVLSAVGALFLAYRQSQAATLTEIRAQRDAYKAMADRAVARLEQEANDRRALAGLAPLPVLAPVVPAHNSPVNRQQQERADFATLQARAAAATLALDDGSAPPAEPLEYEAGVAPMVSAGTGGVAPGSPLQAIEAAAAKVAEAADQIDAAAEAQRAQDAAAKES
jgi:gas vesicle protein